MRQPKFLLPGAVSSDSSRSSRVQVPARARHQSAPQAVDSLSHGGAALPPSDGGLPVGGRPGLHSRWSAEHKVLSVTLMVLFVGKRLAIDQLNATVFGVANDQHIEEAKMSRVLLGHAQFDASQEGIQLIRA